MSDKFDLHFRGGIDAWERALPLGNGRLGALVYGGETLRIALDRNGLWDNRRTLFYGENNLTFAFLKDCVARGDAAAIRETFEAAYDTVPYPTKIPAGAIVLSGGGGKPDFTLHTATAEAVVTYADARLTCFLDADGDRLGYIRAEGNFTPTLIPWYGAHAAPEVRALGYEKPEHGGCGNVCWFRQKLPDGEYAVLLYGRDGYYCFTVAVGGTPGWLEEAVRLLEKNGGEEGYRAARARHRGWWKRFNAKSEIKLPQAGWADRAWHINRYLFGSCSRSDCLPAPLQAVWTADDGSLPPWKGDYHLDLNLQDTYSAYLKANCPEEGRCCVDFLLRLRPQAEAFARDFYGLKGLCLPSTLDAAGYTVGGWAQYTYLPAGHLWMCKVLADYYEYVPDERFLREALYPYFVDTARFLLGFLETDEEGYLVAPLSASPEIDDNWLSAWMTPDTNYDQALFLYFFGKLAELSALVGDGRAEEWAGYGARLRPLCRDERDALKVSADRGYDESHRHLGHAMAVYPLGLIGYGDEEGRRTIDATIADIESRGFARWVGITYPWMSSLFSVQYNGEGAAYMLKLLAECFVSDNGFHLNGDFRRRGLSIWHYKPFTIEANMSFNAALQNMLLSDADGIVDVFPALPDDWEDARFDRFRARGGVIVSADRRGGAVRYIRLRADRDTVVRVRNRLGTGVRCDGALIGEMNGILTVRVPKNRTVTLTPDG